MNQQLRRGTIGLERAATCWPRTPARQSTEARPTGLASPPRPGQGAARGWAPRPPARSYEPRVIAAVNVQPPFEAVPSKRTPPATAAGIVVVLALPGEVNNRNAVALAKSTIEPAANRAELKLAHLFTVKLEEGGVHQIELVCVPQLHLT